MALEFTIEPTKPTHERPIPHPDYVAPTEMTLYAVREVGTGLYFQNLQGTRRGYTHLDPNVINTSFLPRLFATKRNAKIAISAWRQGCWSMSRGYGGGYYGEEYDESIEIEPQAYRLNIDLEIVPVRLTIIAE